MPTNTDLRECIEWDKETRVLRYHFAQPLMANGTTIGQPTCGVPWGPYIESRDETHGFSWHDRDERVLHFNYTIVYCNGCGMGAAGYFHDQRTSRIRQRQRDANQAQREQQRAQENGIPRYSCPECGIRTQMEGTCEDCTLINCGDCRDSYHPDDLNENGLCSDCQRTRDASQEPDDDR